METPVTRSVELGACQAVIDTIGAVCVDPDGREIDVTRVVNFTMEHLVIINAVKIVFLVPALHTTDRVMLVVNAA